MSCLRTSRIYDDIMTGLGFGFDDLSSGWFGPVWLGSVWLGSVWVGSHLGNLNSQMIKNDWFTYIVHYITAYSARPDNSFVLQLHQCRIY